MPIVTYGINQSVPIQLRERWTFSDAQALDTLAELKHDAAMNEAVILSTCNRTEIYTTRPNLVRLENWLNRKGHQAWQEYAYSFSGQQALEHAIRVACGLDSMVAGEPQIFGQIKQAYKLACQVGMVGPQLQQLFPAIFSASKTIRHTTKVTQHSSSLAHVIVQLAKRIFSSLENCRVLLVGSGEMTHLIAHHLVNEKVSSLVVASRRVEKAQAMADAYQGIGIRMADIPEQIKSIDIVISATASQLPLIGKGMMERAIKQKKHRPTLMIDLAVPRDIEPEVAELEDVYLYNLDDLEHLLEKNKKEHQSALAQAETMVSLQAEAYLKQLRILEATDLITRYRQQTERVRDVALQKAHEALSRGKDPRAVLEQFARNLTNKLMHQPTQQIRQAAYENETDLLMLVRRLFKTD